VFIVAAETDVFCPPGTDRSGVLPVRLAARPLSRLSWLRSRFDPVMGPRGDRSEALRITGHQVSHG
jgi:hypothetical protein